MTENAPLGLDNEPSNWRDVPEIVLFEIFSYLVNHEDLYHAGLTCGRWYEASKDDLLWKNLTKRKWGVDDQVSIRPGACSWRDEYKRLFYHSPSVPLATLNEHTLSVEHVSSSNSGKYFVTSSRDSTVKVWELEKPFRLKSMVSLARESSSVYIVMSKFNENDTMLLVANYDDRTSISEIIIFDITGEEMRSLTSTRYRPWYMLSDWYDGDSYIYGVCEIYESTSFYRCMVGLICPQTHYSIRLCKLSHSGLHSMKFIRIANILHISTFNKFLIFVSRYQKCGNKLHFILLDTDDEMQQEPVENDIDKPVHSLEFNGYTCGLALNPEHTFLYINSLDSDILSLENNVLHNMTVHVVDMHTKTITHKFSPGQKSLGELFIHLDVSPLYLASGSVDDAAYLWDLHYGVQVARLPHQPTADREGVGCVAFSHKNQEVLLSVSDDRTVKIWTSRHHLHQTKTV